MNIIRTARTYKTVENAVKALDKECARFGTSKDNLRWLVAVAEDGRYAPVIVGIEHVQFAVVGNITVVS